MFSQSIEGLFIKGLGDRLTSAMRAAVKAAGINLDRIAPAYPVEVMERACQAVAPMLFPEATPAEALRQLGHAFMYGFQSTLIGGAMVQVMKVIGPRRSLERMTKNFRTGGNFIETRFTALGPTNVDLWFNDVGTMPTYFQGIIEEGGVLIGARNLKVAASPETPPAHRYLVTWDA